jgi:hypothetical protein
MPSVESRQATVLMVCRKRLLQMPELEREMELTRRKEHQDDAELLKQLARTRKGDASDQPSEKEVCPPCEGQCP